MRLKRAILAKAALAGGAVLIALAVAEGGLRLFRPILVGEAERHITRLGVQEGVTASREAYDDDADFYGKYAAVAEMEPHPRLKFAPKPSYNGKGYHTNNIRCRYDEDLLPRKPPHEIRVFVTGGLTAWGAGVRQDQAFAALLERKLREAHPRLKLRVICAAAGCYSSAQERGLAEEVIAPMSPDVIVMFSGWNDTYYGYRGANEQGAAERLHYLDAPCYDDYALALHYLAARTVYRIRYMGQLEQLLEAGADRPETVVERLEQNVLAIRELAVRSRAAFLFCLQPTIYETGKTLTPWERQIVESGERAFLGFPRYNVLAYRALRAAMPGHARRHNYRWLDADAAIRDESQSVFVDHVHFGTRGNRLLAAALYPAIEEMVNTRLGEALTASNASNADRRVGPACVASAGPPFASTTHGMVGLHRWNRAGPNYGCLQRLRCSRRRRS